MASPVRVKPILSYILVFDKTSSFLWWVESKVYLKSFTNDQKGAEKKIKFLDWLKKKTIPYIELSLTSEQKKALWNNLTISKQDVQQILDMSFDSLASDEPIESVKRKIMDTKDLIKYNPIFMILLTEWWKVIDILKWLEFGFKKEIMEILTNEKFTNRDRYKKIEKILFFKQVSDQIKGSFRWQMITFAAYMVVMFWVLMWVRYWVFPPVVSKLWWWFGLDVSKMIETPQAMIDWFFYIIIWLISSLAIFFSIYFINKSTFMSILYRIPKLGLILQLWNTLNAIILFTFYYQKKEQFRDKFYELILDSFIIENNKNYYDIWEIALWNLNTIRDKYWILFIDPLVAVSFKALMTWWWSVIEEVSERKINIYIDKMQKAQKEFSTILNVVTLIIIAVMLMITMGAVLSISMWSLSSLQQ